MPLGKTNAFDRATCNRFTGQGFAPASIRVPPLTVAEQLVLVRRLVLKPNDMTKTKTYLFKVEEQSFGTIEVNTSNEEEAYEKAEEIYFEGSTVWKNGDFQITPITERNTSES